MHLIQAEVSAGALRHNVRTLRALLEPGTRICPVVKSNAYGHRLRLAGPVLGEEAGWLAVVSLTEALTLRELGYGGPLLVLFGPHVAAAMPGGIDSLREAVAADVSLTVTNVADLEPAASAAASVGRPVAVHAEVDTGMTRSGMPLDGAPDLLRRIREHPQVVLQGIFTHFSSADDPDPAVTRKQLERFVKLLDACGIGSDVIRHCANSAGSIEFPETRLDMIRPGIAVYGYRTSRTPPTAVPLRPALRVSTRLMQVRDVVKGTRVGYGGTHMFTAPGRVGLIPVGYGDGYPRVLSNRGAAVGVRGQFAPVIGRVSMDQVSVDLTGIPGAEMGDEVEIVSPDPEAPNSVRALAALADTIPHTIVCGLQEHRTAWRLVD